MSAKMELAKMRVEAARQLATWAFRDKANPRDREPCFLHMERVAFGAFDLASSSGGGGLLALEAKAVGYLHDLREDAGHPDMPLRLAFGDRIADAVSLLTRSRIPGGTYAGYVERIAQADKASGDLARIVKLADLADHLAPERVGAIPASLRRRYERAQQVLGRGRGVS